MSSPTRRSSRTSTRVSTPLRLIKTPKKPNGQDKEDGTRSRNSTPLKQVSTPSKRKTNAEDEESRSAISSVKRLKADRFIKTGMTVGNQEDEGSSEEDEFTMARRFDLASKVIVDQENVPVNSMYSFERKKSTLQQFVHEITGKEPASPTFKEIVHERTPIIERTHKRLNAARQTESITNPPLTDSETENEIMMELDVVGDDKISDSDLKNADTPQDAQVDLGESYERFFTDLKVSKKSTSNNTLSQLPPMTQAEYAESLSRVKEKHVGEKKVLRDRLRLYFPQWKFELEQGFSIITYGYGSKRNLLQEFATEWLDDTHVVVINGYFPTVTIKAILLEHVGAMGTVTDQLHLIETYFKQPSPPVPCISLVIHNIDGQNLRTERTHSILASLSKISQIRLVCSIDHINAPLLWDAQLLAKFKFLWHDLTTFEHYDVELSFENRLLTSRNQAGASGAMHVLSTLNGNAQSLFSLLLEHQIESKSGLAYNMFLRQSTENFITSSESGFKTHLTEFKDHKLILAKSVDGGQVLYIPFDQEALEDLSTRLEANKE